MWWGDNLWGQTWWLLAAGGNHGMPAMWVTAGAWRMPGLQGGDRQEADRAASWGQGHIVPSRPSPESSFSHVVNEQGPSMEPLRQPWGTVEAEMCAESHLNPTPGMLKEPYRVPGSISCQPCARQVSYLLSYLSGPCPRCLSSKIANSGQHPAPFSSCQY